MTAPRSRGFALLALVALVASCTKADPSATPEIVLRVRAGRPIDPDTVRFEPARSVQAVRLGPNWIAIQRARANDEVTVHVPDMCPVALTAKSRSPIDVKPLLDLGGDLAQAGFDAEVVVHAVAGCDEARRGRVTWRQIEGQPLRELTIASDGWSLRARTLPLSAAYAGPLPHGLVPISPRTQGRYVLEATWQREAAAPVKRRLTITSIARATGVPSLAVSQRVLLGGTGWHVTKPAHGGKAQVQSAGDYAFFTPDVHGRWALADANEQTLTLQALWHDRTPMDCGRRECHPSASDAATASPMSHALERQFAATGRAPDDVSCMLECHVTGERGIRDGGFLDVATALGFSWLGRPAWDELPPALRRLGGVRCTACHGPGAIPEPSARATILRADVCANCHDAPPRYVHVTEWRSSRMARADESPSTRSDAACARCHTSAGFLEQLGVRKRTDLDVAAAPAGIACAACHAPHAAHSGNRLLRLAAAPPSIADAPALDAASALCANCHAPALEGMPSASAAAIWAGRVRLPASLGEELVSGPATHRNVPGGCTGCHGRRAKPGALDHSFRVDRATCMSCHTAGVPDEAANQASLQSRASELRTQLEQRCATSLASGVPHASPAQLGACATGELGRALYQVLLVTEDPAATVHNRSFASQLLESAAALLREQP